VDDEEVLSHLEDWFLCKLETYIDTDYRYPGQWGYRATLTDSVIDFSTLLSSDEIINIRAVSGLSVAACVPEESVNTLKSIPGKVKETVNVTHYESVETSLVCEV